MYRFSTSGAVETVVNEAQLKSLVPEFLDNAKYFEHTDLFKVRLQSWMEYVQYQTSGRCNIAWALYGESFCRHVGNKLKFKSAGAYEELSWREFISFMERAYIACFEPSVAHQDAILKQIHSISSIPLSENYNFEYDI